MSYNVFTTFTTCPLSKVRLANATAANSSGQLIVRQFGAANGPNALCTCANIATTSATKMRSTKANFPTFMGKSKTPQAAIVGGSTGSSRSIPSNLRNEIVSILPVRNAKTSSASFPATRSVNHARTRRIAMYAASETLTRKLHWPRS